MKNALLGYTYQHYVACLFLARMDVEREIDRIVLEADVEHKFDDISIEISKEHFFLQIKDVEKVDIKSLSVDGDRIKIGGTSHQLSKATNIIFFRYISFKSNCEILGFAAIKISGVYIVSLSRNDIDKKIEHLYRKDLHRKGIIEQFLSDRLDSRIFDFTKIQLPQIGTFSTKLVERTIRISRALLKFKNILQIEGKPGIGKSHLVGYLEKEFSGSLTYRFWISNQDRAYEERLRYDGFLSDISKKLFSDYKVHSEDEIISKLASSERVFIIDGLDHVENYNIKDLQRFIAFINKVSHSCKTIVLSRPLKTSTEWKKQVLSNWNDSQTKKVLKDLFHIEDYPIVSDIYQITGGYPILVSHVAQHYKKNGNLPTAEKFETINSYYDHLLSNEKSRQALALFLCSRGFLMRTEIRMFLEDYAASMVEEFVDQNPYLFELRLNRISLFHDSLVTYLRDSGVSYTKLQEQFTGLVYSSIISGEKRFQSRLGHFDFSNAQAIAIIKRHSSMKSFSSTMKNVVDFEAIRDFYEQIRNMLSALLPQDLETIEYYDLSLIINIVNRDHVSSSIDFQYTLTQTLLFNDYNHEDITSSKYLFGMWYYIHTSDSTLIYNSTSDDHYDTQNFNRNLTNEIEKEQTFFEFQKYPFELRQIKKVLQDTKNYRYTDYIEYVLVNLFLHEKNRDSFPKLFLAVQTYMNNNQERGSRLLVDALSHKYVDYRRATYMLSKVKKELYAYGIFPDRNDYRTLSLKDYIAKHRQKGSFDLRPEILSFLRLSLENKQKIDLGSISRFWTKYHMRKDYTLYALDHALTVFEQKNWIDWRMSLKLITQIQEVSEKGYRDLLARYIELHNPEFLHNLLAEFPPNSLHISWFHLPHEFIDILPYSLYESAMVDIFKSSHSGGVDISDVRNLLKSTKIDLLRKDLKMIAYRLKVKPGDDLIEILDRKQIPYKILEPDKSESEAKTSEERYLQGTIDYKNKDIITKEKLTPSQVAITADANYTVLADPALYTLFKKSRIKRELKEILYCALTAKSKSSDYHHVTWLMPGTVLKIMLDSNTPISKDFFNSFNSYLDYSMFALK